MTESHNQTGPRTEEGKQISSQNAFKHGLFSTKVFLLPGESQEEYDKLIYRYTREYNPKGVTEEDLVNYLAQTEWRRRRIPSLEHDAIMRSLESGDGERKFLHTYSIYEQRFTRAIQATLKTLSDHQAERRRGAAVRFRIAIILYKYNKAHNIPWDPAEDGFVFSTSLLHKRLDLADRCQEANYRADHFATDDEIDIFIAQPIM